MNVPLATPQHVPETADGTELAGGIGKALREADKWHKFGAGLGLETNFH